MKLNEYQLMTNETVSDQIKGNINYFILGLNGEAGEVAEKYKKFIRDGSLNYSDLIREAGDVLWYVAQLAQCCGVTLEEVANTNLEKLKSRKVRGKISGSGDNR